MANTGGEEKRILILCVDRDDDLGKKTGIKTPILGRDENLNAAIALALRDPEEPDANAIFESIRVYDRLYGERKSNEVFQVATITGSEFGGISADRKLVTELNEVLEKFRANEVILVTDGYSDEAVLPLIESRVPVSSVRRIVVRHSKSIEETAALFTRYLKILLEHPRYSRIVLGLPGLLLITLSIILIFGFWYYYWIAFLLVLGVYFFYKGFRIDDYFKAFYSWIKEYSPPPLPVQIVNFSALTAFICVVIGIFLGWNGAVTEIKTPPANVEGWITLLPAITGGFIGDSIDLIIVGVCVLLFGRAVKWYFERDIRLLRTLVIVSVLVWSRQIFIETSEILKNPELSYERLVFSAVIGIMIAIATILIVFVIYRTFHDFFERKEEQIEEFGEES
jgi:putative membrane protein